jgi:uroporphyrinogen-III synthase
MRVLVTRPEADAAELVAALEARGHQALVQPLLDIEPIAPEPPLELAGAQALLFTSANGVRAFARVTPERGLPVLTVGDASAAAARAAGFDTVDSAGGDVEDLARLVRERLAPEAGALLHGAGSSLAGDLKGELERAGFEVRRSVLYRAEPVRALSEPVRTALTAGALDAVLFFSPRTAKTFVRLVADHGLGTACERCLAVCLSAAVAANLRALTWAGVRTAARPDQQALLACLDETDGAAAAGAREHEEVMAQDSASQDSTPAQRVISAFGGIRPMAHTLGVAVSTVQGWKERGVIPPGRQAQVLEAAAAKGIDVDAAAFSPAARPAGPSRTRVPDTRSADPKPAAEGEVLPPRARDEAPAEAAEAPAPPPPPRRSRGPMIVLVIAVVLGLAVLGVLMPRDLWYPGTAEDGAPAQPEPAPAATAPAAPQPAPELASIRDRLDALGGELSALDDRFGRLEEQAAAPDLSADRLAALATAQEALEGRIAAQEALEGRIAALEAPSSELEALEQRLEQRFEQRLEQRLEQRIGALASQSGLSSASGQVALMLALEQLREALALSGPFADALDLLDDALGDDPETTALLAPLRAQAASGVASRAALARDFAEVARAVTVGAAGGEGDGPMSGVLRRFSDLITVRPVGDVPGGDPGAIVARAEHRLAADDLAGAVAELAALDGPAAAAAAGWRARAEARLSVETALSALRARVIARLAQAGG